ncbi:MAG: hypothetical protein ACAI25_00610 [Planctomycetota bacterium]
MRELFVALIAVVLLFAGCGSDEKKPDDKSSSSSTASGTPEPSPCACGTATAVKAGATCTCADIRTAKTGWCDHCGMGQVSGTKTSCAVCAKAGKLCEACVATGGKPCDDCAARMPK